MAYKYRWNLIIFNVESRQTPVRSTSNLTSFVILTFLFLIAKVLSLLHVLLRAITPDCIISHGKLLVDEKSCGFHSTTFRHPSWFNTSTATSLVPYQVLRPQNRTSNCQNRLPSLWYSWNGQIFPNKSGTYYFKCGSISVEFPCAKYLFPSSNLYQSRKGSCNAITCIPSTPQRTPGIYEERWPKN